jgi:hypothetical protein
MDGMEQDAPVTMKMWAGCPLSLRIRAGRIALPGKDRRCRSRIFLRSMDALVHVIHGLETS